MADWNDLRQRGNPCWKVSGHDMRLVDFTSIRGSFNVTNVGKDFVHFREMYNIYIQLGVL